MPFNETPPTPVLDKLSPTEDAYCGGASFYGKKYWYSHELVLKLMWDSLVKLKRLYSSGAITIFFKFLAHTFNIFGYPECCFIQYPVSEITSVGEILKENVHSLEKHFSSDNTKVINKKTLSTEAIFAGQF